MADGTFHVFELLDGSKIDISKYVRKPHKERPKKQLVDENGEIIKPSYCPWKLGAFRLPTDKFKNRKEKGKNGIRGN